jgi:hypothetical protein
MDVGFEDPVKGVVVGPNLTPDKATGLGLWTDRQIEIAPRAGANFHPVSIVSSGKAV